MASSVDLDAVCVVQARTGSSRLPGKVLADVSGRPLLRFMLERLSPLGIPLVVATTDRPQDDVVASIAEGAGVRVVRGPELDVLARYVLALEAHPSEHVIRLTADCPLVDPDVVRATVDHHQRQAADYTSNVLPRTLPKGLDVEVMRASALRTAAREAHHPIERDHVTPYLYRHPERFRLANRRWPASLGEERWTVDTPADLAFVRAVVARLGSEVDAGWRRVLEVAGRQFHPPAGGLHLRPAAAEDSQRLLEWRNDPDAIRFSGTGRGVSPEEHGRWFAERLGTAASRLWVAEVDQCPMASVRIDVEQARGLVSVVVAPEARGKGVAAASLGLLLRALDDDCQVVGLDARVSTANPASSGAFRKAGFAVVAERDGVLLLGCERPWPTPFSASRGSVRQACG